VGAGGPLLAALAAIAPGVAEPLLAWAAPVLQRDPDGRQGGSPGGAQPSGARRRASPG